MSGAARLPALMVSAYKLKNIQISLRRIVTLFIRRPTTLMIKKSQLFLRNLNNDLKENDKSVKAADIQNIQENH